MPCNDILDRLYQTADEDAPTTRVDSIHQAAPQFMFDLFYGQLTLDRLAQEFSDLNPLIRFSLYAASKGFDRLEYTPTEVETMAMFQRGLETSDQDERTACATAIANNLRSVMVNTKQIDSETAKRQFAYRIATVGLMTGWLLVDVAKARLATEVILALEPTAAKDVLGSIRQNILQDKSLGEPDRVLGLNRVTNIERYIETGILPAITGKE